MPRPLRVQVPGAIYHVNARANRGSALYFDDADRKVFLWISLLVADEHEWRVHAWCLLTTHYHLLFCTPRGDLAAGMHRINSRYANWINERHGFSGHVFERRYHAELVASDEHLLETYRYLARNPVRAGLCARARDWRWSSYGALIGCAGDPVFPPERLCEHFGTGARGRQALRRFVEPPP